MTWSQFTYLSIDLLSLAGPFAYGFTLHSGFNSRWREFLPGLLVIGSLFIAWDAAFTANGIWGFNSNYHLPFKIVGMPIEEWLFFFCIPFACLFIHDCVKYLKKWFPPEKHSRLFFFALGSALGVLAAFNLEKAYTVSSLGLAAMVCILIAMGGLRNHTGHFILTFLFHCIPFFLVNGILTSIPIVTYHDFENLGIRFGSIPVEDLAYSLSLIGLNVMAYEFLLRRKP